MRYASIILIGIIALSSCKSAQEKLQDKIAGLEQIDTGSSHLSALADAYMEFLEKFEAGDSIKEAYLSNSATYFAQFDRYEECLNSLKKLRPQMGDTIYLRSRYSALEGYCYAKLGQNDLAITTYEEIARERPLQPTSSIELTQLYLRKSKESTDQKEKENAHLKAARLLTHSGDIRIALDELTRFYTSYPESDKSPYAMFEAANILEQHFQDIDSAGVLLAKLIDNYPESPFAKDATIYLEKGLLGKTDLEKLKIITGQ